MMSTIIMNAIMHYTWSWYTYDGSPMSIIITIEERLKNIIRKQTNKKRSMIIESDEIIKDTPTEANRSI